MPRRLSGHEIDSFRDELCRAATRMHAERGTGAVTLRGLAREVGCSPMTPYRYFADKEAILSAVRAAACGRLADRCEDAADTADDPLHRLSALAEAHVQFALAEPRAYGLLFESEPAARADRELAEQSDRLSRIERGTVEEAVRSGALAADPGELANLLRAGVHGAITLHLARKLDARADLSGLAAAVVRTLLRGISDSSGFAPLDSE